MAKPRYRRVNIDGQSLYKTETFPVKVATKPGTFAILDTAVNKFQIAVTADAQKKLYIIGAAEHQGLGIMDDIPANDSGIGNLWEDGRVFAVRVVQGFTCVKDAPITLHATTGYGVVGVVGTNVILGFAEEAVTISGSGGDDFVRVRASRRAIS
jgi:hypothetical protein